MLQFTTIIKKFAEKGDKTGWTYIDVPEALAQKLKPGNKKAFRVKGRLDQFPFEGISLIPMGGGHFIMPLNAATRKGIRKQQGATLLVQLMVDENEVQPPVELMECLADEPQALLQFNKMPKSHQNYYTRWINEAKTEATKAKRISQTVTALLKGFNFSQALQSIKASKDALL
jgi:hypothetical protein